MRKTIGVALIYGIIIAEIFFVVWLAILRGAIRSFDPATQTWFDGFSRKLENTPSIVSVLFYYGNEWSGWGYFFLDTLVIFLLIAIGYRLVMFAVAIQSHK